MRKKRQKWTDEMLRNEALKYKTRGAFRKGSPNAYLASKRRGIIDKVCSHMEFVKYTHWTNDMLHDEALKYKTRGAFQKGSVSAYCVCLKRGVLDDVCKHMKSASRTASIWSDELLRDEALKFNTRNEFKKGSERAYRACLKRGILDNVCSHMECGRFYWSDEALREEALKFKTRNEFAKESPYAYRTCLNREILDDVCKHMEYVYTYWSDEMLHDEALKYKTRFEFYQGSTNAYSVALGRKILDDICKHMEKLPHWDKPHCVYLIEIYTTANELYYYVGQTSNLEERLRMHFCRKDSYTSVSDFLNKNSIKYKKHQIVKNNLSYKESLALERETIENLKNRGVRLLNKELCI